jgi:membrane-bound lytic murein transglycosylase D
VDLALVAEYAGIENFDLKKANAELHYGITPPDTSYYIKVPTSLAPAVAAVLENEELTLIKYYIHTIRSGDTLWGITRRYGITESQLISQNPGLQNKFLKIGTQLIIPAFKEVSDAATTPKTTQQPQQKTAPASFTGTHLVKRGETLWSIARAYNIDPETLARVNNMGPGDVLRTGSILKTPAIP